MHTTSLWILSIPGTFFFFGCEPVPDVRYTDAMSEGTTAARSNLDAGLSGNEAFPSDASTPDTHATDAGIDETSSPSVPSSTVDASAPSLSCPLRPSQVGLTCCGSVWCKGDCSPNECARCEDAACSANRVCRIREEDEVECAGN
jgi:hypothetical protein